jgi:hypothetical protein
VTPLSLANIQTVSVQAVGNSTLGLQNAPAVTTINVVGSTGTLGLGNVQNALTGLTIANQGSDVTLTTVATALSGTSDVLNVSLSAVTGGALEANPVSGTNGYETIAITSGGAIANTLASLAATGANTLTIAGAQNLTITGVLPDAITTVNAAAATGNVTLTFGDAVHNVTGGAGNDRFVFDGNYVGAAAGDTPAQIAARDVINGGAGRDTLVLTSASANRDAAQSNVTNIEIIEISNAVANNINLTRFASADTLRLTSDTFGGHTYTFNSGSTLAITEALDDTGNPVRGFVIGGNGTADSLTINAVTGTNFGTGAQTFTGIETLTINTGSAVAGVTGNVTFGGTLVLVPTNSPPFDGNLIVAGANNLVVTGAVTASTINASGLTGNASLSLGANTVAPGGVIITGSSNADVLRGSDVADVINAGAGNDIIHGTTGRDVMTLGAGNDVVVYTAVNQSIAGAVGDINTWVALVDVITDWSNGTNRIDLSGVLNVGTTFVQQSSIQDAIAAANATTLGEAFTAAALRIGADGVGAFSFGGNTYVLAQDNNAALAVTDMVIRLDGEHVLTGANFILA